MEKILPYTTLKNGPNIPLLFLHGFLGTPHDWQPLSSHLPSSHCIASTLPGHNHTPFTKNFTIPFPRFHLIGYSLGGRIANDYAQKHPEQIASLTLISAHPGLLTFLEKQNRLQSDKAWARLLQTLPIDEFLKRWYDQELFKDFCPDFAMRKNHNPNDLAKCLLHFSLAKQTHNAIDEMIVGERDLKFRSLCKRPIIIPNAGHMAHIENPKAVAMAITKRIFI